MRAAVQKIGLVGLGLMGNALAGQFLKSGFQVVGFDLDLKQKRALAGLGGTPVGSAGEIVDACQRIVFSLPTTDIVESVVGKMKGNLRAGTIIIDTTTGEPEQTKALAAKLAKKRVRYLDATIVGNSEQVRAGDVIVLVGGSRATFKACRDVFDCFTRQAFHVGPCGSAARMKLIVNLVLGLNRAALAEGLAFARAVGVSPRHALEILKAGASYSRVMDTKGKKMLTRDFSPQARLSQHLKDVRLILSLGKRVKLKLPMSALHCKLLEKVEAVDGGQLDNSAIIKAFE